MRYLTLGLIFAVLAAACNDGNGPRDPEQALEGVYELTAINGQALPFGLSANDTVHSGALWIGPLPERTARHDSTSSRATGTRVVTKTVCQLWHENVTLAGFDLVTLDPITLGVKAGLSATQACQPLDTWQAIWDGGRVVEVEWSPGRTYEYRKD